MPPVNEILLKMENVSKSFGGVIAVQDYNMELPRRGIHGIIGPNGAGKTTIFNLISRIYPVDAGNIRFLGRDVTKNSQIDVARLGLSRTFQNTRLFTALSVLDNVKVGLDHAGKYSIIEALFLAPRRWKEERRIAKEASACLEALNLQKYAKARPGNLPYGIQRRVEIARAIVGQPKLLMLDEPAAGLNPEEVLELVDFIRHIKREYDLTILVIEHRMDLIMTLCELIHVQNFGRTIAVGTPGEVQINPHVLAAYLGKED